ncbi:ATP F0F1 synthase subunit B' [Thioclava sp. SK-1]|uniref:F0F1 ATP synthase subunit B' n=1 Tax=Thioclava sp. SK-1 TaxID=1889770 RepID=UPI00082402DB|nr:F0F1 ATP synthase subunit B' [Thioclava sp. SK-1]OCX66796.1 ATP F0F1 synthase subunit B' [Thioclava sp. SK-1]
MATEHEAAEMAHGAADAAHGAALAPMPQLEPSYFGNLIFWLLVTLVAIYWLLSKIALPRISSVLADRQGTISGDLAAAEDYKLKAKDAEAAYEKALADARAQAQAIVGEARAAIQKDVDAAIVRADAEIAAKTTESQAKIAEIQAGAVEAVDTVAKDTALAIVAALGGNADKAVVDAAVSTRLKG